MSEDDFLQGDLIMKTLGTLEIGSDRTTSFSDEILLKSSNNSMKSDESSPNNASPLLDTHQTTTEDPSICPYCDKKYRKPRVLDCLHSLCHDCIIAQLDGRNRHSFAKFVDLEMELENTHDNTKPPPGVIRCPICTQETHIGNDQMFVNLMLMDYIRIRKYGIDDSDYGKVCQACKSEDMAVANCSNCMSDLCQKCVQAHMDMKMFDGHKVSIFTQKDKVEQQIMSGVEPKKTAICEKHKMDFDKFCIECEEIICPQCFPEHATHNSCSPLGEHIINWCKDGIKELAKQAQIKGKATLEARSKIPEREEMLSESYAKCRDKIEESFQKYALILNEVKLELLISLEKNRDEQQENLNTSYQKIDKQTNMLQDALTYTNQLLDEGTVVDLITNRKKVWRQLKLLIHSMPDGNAEVDLDYDALVEEEFKKKLEMVVGNIKCRVTGLPKETKNLNAQPLLGAGATSSKLEGFSGDLDSKMAQLQMFTGGGWDSPNIVGTSSALQQQQPTPNYQGQPQQGPGAIGMERRLNRNSTNGTSYLSGDSGIYSSASDMTISSPIANQLNTSLEQFGMNMGAAGRFDPFNAAAAFRNTPNANIMQNPLDINTQFDTAAAGALFSSAADQFNQSGQSKTWSMNMSNNIFGPFEQQQQRPRELIESRFMMNEFPPLGTDPSGMRSRSSLCNTPSVEAFVSTPVSLPIHQAYPTNIGGRSHFSGGSQLEMTIAATFSADNKNAQDTFNTPQGLALGIGNEVAIADTNNHRCIVVDLKGNILRQIGSSGTEEGHVYYPKKIVAHVRERDCRFIVLDRGTGQQFNRLQLFKNDGTYISRLALPCPVDQVSVMSWNKDNEQLIIIDSKNLIMAFQFETFNQLSLVRQFSISGHVHEPSDIGVYKGNFYITDYKMHAVVVYNMEGKFFTKFGGLDTTPYPVGIDFSKSGDILVGDSHGNHFHIVVFNNQGMPQHHYRCYQQKVSRCTGLKINSEGNILTMSRQNSSIIVFNTLYLPTQA